MNATVVGAGTIGSYLAMRLGEKAEVIERRKSLERKTCGGLVSKKGIEKLRVPYEEAIVNEVNTASIQAGREVLEVKRKDTQAYVLNMLKLKEEMQEKATDNGATFRFSETWGKGRDEGKILVGADGALSTVAKQKSTLNPIYHTYQIIADWEGERNKVHLYFGNYSPEFFGWIIPYEEGNAKIGIATINRDPRKALNRFMGTERIKIGKIHSDGSSPIPLFNPEKQVVGEDWALVGDSAGQTKATTGGGVALGLEAADYLVKAIENQKLVEYRNRYEENLKPILKDHLEIRRFLNSVNKEKLISKLNKHGMKEVIEEYGEMERTDELKKEVMKKALKKPALWLLGVSYLLK